MNKILKILFIAILLSVATCFLPHSTKALDPYESALFEKKFIDITKVGDAEIDAETISKGALMKVFTKGRNLLGLIAIGILVLGGIRLGIAQSDDSIKGAREMITDALIAMVIVTMAPIIVSIFYQGGNVDKKEYIGDPGTIVGLWDNDGKLLAAEPIYVEIYKITDFVTLTLIPIMIGLIIYYGVMFMFSFGDSEFVKKQEKALIWNVIGTVIILMARVIIKIFLGEYDVANKQMISNIDQNSGQFIVNLAEAKTQMLGLANTFLYVAGAVALVMTIYAGYNILISMDDEENAAKYKKQVGYNLIAIVLIVSAYIIVNTFTTGKPII
ncbi:MAG: hypothetical protein NTZ80_02575 [Patescibacteria group bacterium]|nr:hypothetical protein [Patescibacteria group bacterium]